MKQRVIILLGFFILFCTGCSEKQEAIVNSGSNQQLPTEMPAEVKLLLDQNTIPDGVELPEIVASPPGFDFSSINDSIYDVYMVAFLWGHLVPFGPPAETPLDWSGSLSVNGPSPIRVITTVAFERGQDSLIPEDRPSAVQWASHTLNRFDGIVCLVLYDKVNPTLVPQVLTFNTPPINLEFDFSQLSHLYEFYQVDRHNSVAVAARKINIHRCREGYFKGAWQKSDSSDFRGHFRGLWFNKSGDTLGALSGNYWKNEDGAQLLEGWVSAGITGQVIAELRGHWIFDDHSMCPTCGAGHGQIKGRFKVLHSEEHGYFRGEFGDYSPPPNDRNMPLHGRWQLDCVNTAGADDPGTF